ncbi:Bis(5'-nucleosyl)-tetraphosphatase [Aquipluma nitroreducens]|uniref:Bis(5'-nucleosyl)-tetraphosphatase n=1 Tax=Aquipluma nitroreducens TaxID=2010828 RepID=A0A5K7S518_9BACT|nr:NUDIX domain-containing protein [Aquipluma nitroreducens]BBE16580.1 Bis(5'-nucleosyl)-tetraphosphatase [Aquipluma nitroreducens]
MYKVFFNGSIIQFGSEMNKSLNNNITEIFDLVSYDVVNQIISQIESTETPSGFFILNHEVDTAWEHFKSQFVEIPAAGGLVRNSEGAFLFIKRLGVWDLPKGKIEKKETPELAAVREVEEECGLSGLHVINQLDSTFHIYRSPYLPHLNNLVLKETKWFLMNYSGNEIPVPQVEEDIHEVTWFSIADLDRVYSKTYSSLIDFLKKSLPII